VKPRRRRSFYIRRASRLRSLLNRIRFRILNEASEEKTQGLAGSDVGATERMEEEQLLE
jgi:hypothetical protein